MNDETLQKVGRKHSVNDIIECFQLARELGFDNINMDIILGLVDENLAMVENTLKEIEDAKILMKDEELKEVAKEELDALKEKLEKITKELEILLVPKDEYDRKKYHYGN